MKIGILTFHFSKHNYGAVLQTYASYINLKKLGFEPKVINLKPKIKNSLKSHLLSAINGSSRFDNFRNKYLEMTSQINNYDDLKKTNQEFDVFYVGSDQVWRSSMAKDMLNHYFLDFVKPDKIKIAYAVSFGSNNWEATYEKTEEIKKLIKKFHSVLVRENRGIEICKQTFDINADFVLDPTLLISKDEYIKYLKLKKNESEKYIGIYLLSDRALDGNILEKIRYQTKFRIINLYGKKCKILNKQIFRFNTIRGWINGILNSELVITDSFHCMVFAIILRKKFIVINNNYRGPERIMNLLELLGLNERLCYDTDKIDINNGLKSIDFISVHALIDKHKSRSLNLLIQSLRSPK